MGWYTEATESIPSAWQRKQYWWHGVIETPPQKTKFHQLRYGVRIHQVQNQDSSLTLSGLRPIQLIAPTQPIGQPGDSIKVLGAFKDSTFLKGKVVVVTGRASGFGFWLARLRQRHRQRLDSLLPTENTRQVAQAFLLGETATLSPELKDAYRRSGLYHILALSGSHVALVITMIFGLVGRIWWLGISRRMAYALALAAIWVYIVYLGSGPSILRAGIMASLSVVGFIFWRRQHALQMLAVALCIQLILFPDSLANLGFQLSYLGVAGILFITQPIERLTDQWPRWLRILCQPIWVTLGAQIAVTPLLLFFFGSFPVYFIVSNLVAHVLIVIALPLGYGVLIVEGVPLVGEVATQLFTFLLQQLNSIAVEIAHRPEAAYEPAHISTNALIVSYVLIGFFTLLGQAVLGFRQQNRRTS
jgi:ComEC/Rec2-related protein